MVVKDITEDMYVRIRSMIASGLGFKAIGKNIGVSYRLVMQYCENNGLIERNEYGKIKVRDYKPGSFKNCSRCKFRLNCQEKDKNAFRCGKYAPDYKLIQERIDRNRMIIDWNERDQIGGV